MAREEYIKSYYESSISTKWIDIHQSVKCCIEKFLAELLFKNDYSRVVFSPSDSVFRRRIETVDKGKKEDTQLTPITLNLPFAAYHQSGDWEADDRSAVMNTSQAVLGIYDMNIYRRLRSLACKATYKAQIFFNSREDVRAAQQLLYWEQEPKHPIWIYSCFNWKGKPLAIPAFLTIESINTTPEWEELKFLENQRIFPIEVEFTVRSYQVVVPNVDGIVRLPYRFQNYEVDEGDNMYITEETVLEFVNEKWSNIDVETSADSDDEELNAYAKKYFEDDDYTEEQVVLLGKQLMNDTTYDIIKGYFTETTEVNLDAFYYYEPTSTPTTAVIKFKIKPADRKYFQTMKILIPGRTDPVVITDCKQNEVTLEGLNPNSTYDLIILTYSTSGNITTFNLSLTTKADTNDLALTPTKINKKISGLIGRHL